VLPRVAVEGRVVADPELRFASTGTAVGSFRLVAQDRRKEGDEWVDGDALWLPVTCFKKLAENVIESVMKGDLVVVTGKIKTDEWETEQGEKRSRVVMIADTVSVSLAFRTVPHSAGRAERQSSAPQEDKWSSPQQSEEPPF